MTVSAIKKSIDQEMRNLTPTELAKYIWDEQWRVSEMGAAGEDTTDEEKEIKEVYEKYVLTRSIYDYAAFWRGMYFESKEYWGLFFLGRVFPGLVREHALIGLFMLEMIKRSRLLKFQREKDPSELKLIRERISEMLPRYRRLGDEIRAIVRETELWNLYGLCKPDLDFERQTQFIEDYIELFLIECEIRE